jgi:hypothetical protein
MGLMAYVAFSALAWGWAWEKARGGLDEESSLWLSGLFRGIGNLGHLAGWGFLMVALAWPHRAAWLIAWLAAGGVGWKAAFDLLWAQAARRGRWVEAYWFEGRMFEGVIACCLLTAALAVYAAVGSGE